MTKVGFDAKRAVQNNTGLGNYSRYIVEILARFYPDTEYLLFAPVKKDNARLHTLLSLKNVRFLFASGFWKMLPSIWRVGPATVDIERNGVDIFHGLSNELPVGIQTAGCKSVVTIHDLIFIRYPQYYKPIDRIIYRWKFRYACRKADKVIAVSECTKRDILSYFQIPSEKVEVVYQGCHPDYKKEITADEVARVRQVYQLPSEYILYVGSIEARKNLMLVVKALPKMSSDIHLVAVGKPTPYQEQIEQFVAGNCLSSRVHLLNHVPFEDLPALYKGARVFVYPSFMEGFGIPVIEALSAGIPVVAATGSCLEEAGGEHSLYVHPEKEDELAEAVAKIWSNPELARSMSAFGKEYVKKFDDEAVAAEIMRVYRSL